MDDHEKTRDQLLSELQQTRKLLAELAAKEQPLEIARKELQERSSVQNELSAMCFAAIGHLDGGKIKWLNDAARRILGFENEEDYLGISIREFFESEEEYERVGKILYGGVGPGQYSDVETTLVRHNGSLLHARIRFEISDPTNPSKGTVATFSEVVDRSGAEEALKESEERYRVLSQEALIGIYIHQDGKFVYVNDHLARLLGRSAEEMLGKEFWEFVLAEDRGLVRERGLARSMGKTVEPHYQFRAICKNGETRLLEVFATTIRYGGRSANMGNVLDVTRRNWAEEALRQSEQKYRLIFENSPLGIFHFDSQGVITACNENFVRIIGSSKEVLVGLDMFRNLKDKRMLTEIKNALRGEEGRYEGYYASVTADKVTPVRCYFRRLESEHGSLMGGIGIVEDVTERKKFELELEAETERLRVTLGSIGDGVISTDTGGRVALINNVAEHLTGWSHREALGKRLRQVFKVINEKTRMRCEDPVEKVVRTGKVIGLANHTILVSKDGSERIIADSGAPIRDKEGKIIGVVIVFRDVTEKQKIENELIRMEKLESVGILAGGIAHDFNNILTVILGNVTLAKLFCKPGEKVHYRLSEAEKAVMRAQDLTRQLLTFAKGGTPVKATASIADIVKESCAFALTGSNVKFEARFAEDLWNAEVDKGQISQVINNLIINAGQAMPMGGKIKITASNQIIPEGSPGRKPGKFIKITIKDEGSGIPKEHLLRIFDPYFTTKSDGTGLGLATSYSIIKKHDGMIDVDSRLGKGTTFSLYLPASGQTKLESQDGSDYIFTGSGKVLLMDDEENILELAGEMLAILGFEVVMAKDGAEAVELFRSHFDSPNPFTLVIMDLTVPGGLGGAEAIKLLLEIDPNVKAIVSSGYCNDPVMAQYERYGFSGVVVKPYNVRELSNVLAKVLAHVRANSPRVVTA
ncbi:MAG: PAS domain S-box protein [Desulfomonile tiedjei]|uniref:histidine kinase n=1 Tax=Desulfomonile tiedjei TaxID=2358 RepID=A0A9D6V2E7_9BACT|nr:PAS domain S-box protein [Desulfomonile tiedjei]